MIATDASIDVCPGTSQASSSWSYLGTYSRSLVLEPSLPAHHNEHKGAVTSFSQYIKPLTEEEHALQTVTPLAKVIGSTT